jgi:prepilin signal peptidase PulO-like enzyme (type II secretory pathway)
MFSVSPALLALVLVGSSIQGALVVWSFVLVVGLAAISHVDWQSRTIPDAIVVPLALLGLLFTISTRGDWALNAVFAFGLLSFAVIWARFQANDRAPIGGGDVLLAVAGICWIGPAVFLDVVILSAVLVIPTIVWHKLTREVDAMVPLAPAYSVALLSVWFGLRLL